MRRILLGALPYLVLAALLAVRAWDPIPLQQLRWLAFDTYQRLAPRPYDPALPVKIVDMDDELLARIGQWPWPRTYVADLVERIAAAGPAAIAFDVVFAEPDRSSPEQALKMWPATLEVLALRDSVAVLPSHDSILADAMAAVPVVTGFVLNQGTPGSDGTDPARHHAGPTADPLAAWALAQGWFGDDGAGAGASRSPAPKATFATAGDEPAAFAPQFTQAVTNLPQLEAVAAGNGAINSTPERDQVIRRVPMILALDDALYPSLAAEALRVAQGAQTNVVKSSGASGVLSFGEHTGISAIRIGELEVPTDANGRLWVRFGRHEPARFIPAWTILEEDFDPATIAGQIVLVGTSAAGLHDIRATPLDPSIPGVEVHAQAIEQILRRLRTISSANSVVVAVPPRSRVRTRPSIEECDRATRGCASRPPTRRGGRASSAPTGGARSDWRCSCRRCRARCRARPRRPRSARRGSRPARAQPADESGAEVGDDVAVEIRQQQHVELLRPHHELHARCVDDPFAVGDVRARGGHLARRVEEQPVAELHDVRFVDRDDAAPAVLARVIEREHRDARGRPLGDDLQAFDDARHDLVFEPRIEILRVLAHDDQVHVLKAARHAREVPHRPEVRVQIERLAQPDVHAREACRPPASSPGP